MCFYASECILIYKEIFDPGIFYHVVLVPYTSECEIRIDNSNNVNIKINTPLYVLSHCCNKENKFFLVVKH